ncbi:MAG TPA: hypothetical protein VHE34_14925 [Puia sp.]|uniref:hypothetical protein n=1 Tax=Puia sp. TaxID=2045100 RepID=UPI002C7CCDF3|nr:hypothetical protein [Puia sp.]HVU96519.1 hypothetical protein [Puia sp.]
MAFDVVAIQLFGDTAYITLDLEPQAGVLFHKGQQVQSDAKRSGNRAMHIPVEKDVLEHESLSNGGSGVISSTIRG